MPLNLADFVVEMAGLREEVVDWGCVGSWSLPRQGQARLDRGSRWSKSKAVSQPMSTPPQILLLEQVADWV